MRSLLRRTAAYTATYAAVELAAVALLMWAFGLGWTLVVLAATFGAGVLVSASQVRGQVAGLRSRRTPQGAIADGALVGLGSFLVFLPGVVSTAAGVLMLAPPTRAAMRPLAQTLIARGIAGRITLVRTGQVIDGEVIDGEVIGTPNLPAAR
jgi:UPF0716 protein FxsA